MSLLYTVKYWCRITAPNHGADTTTVGGISDVKFHAFFCREIFHEIFLKYFKNFTMLLNNGQHRSKKTQYKQTNRHYIPFL